VTPELWSLFLEALQEYPVNTEFDLWCVAYSVVGDKSAEYVKRAVQEGLIQWARQVGNVPMYVRPGHSPQVAIEQSF
jgi:hypothetical protein